MVLARHGRDDDAFTSRQHSRSRSRFRIAGAQMAWLGSLGRLALQQPFSMSRGNPAALFRDADGNYVVFLLVDRIQYRCRRQQRDFMFAAAPAEQDTYADFLHAFDLNA